MAKKISKTQKKLDNTIRLVLTDVCERSLKSVEGFKWLTHQADFSNFPASLLITCVFDSETHYQAAAENGCTATLRNTIQTTLLKSGVRLKSQKQQIIFDTEDACQAQHNGDWTLRLGSRAGKAVPKNRPN